jgi:hypothetical protein
MFADSKHKLLMVGLIFLIILLTFVVCGVLFQETEDGEGQRYTDEERAKTGLICITVVAEVCAVGYAIYYIFKG